MGFAQLLVKPTGDMIVWELGIRIVVFASATHVWDSEITMVYGSESEEFVNQKVGQCGGATWLCKGKSGFYDGCCS